MAKESRRTGADKLQDRSAQNTVFAQGKCRGRGADTALQSMEWSGRRLTGRYTPSVLDIGLTRERSKAASTAPRR